MECGLKSYEVHSVVGYSSLHHLSEGNIPWSFSTSSVHVANVFLLSLAASCVFTFAVSHGLA